MAVTQPAPRRSRSTDEAVRVAGAGRVRVLTDADTSALTALVDAHPVANAYLASLLHGGRLAGPRGGSGGTLFLGVGDPGSGPGDPLHQAAWVGSNVVPAATDEPPAPELGAAVAALRRRFGSLYGPAAHVAAIEQRLREAGHRPRSLRPEQPLLVAGEPSICRDDAVVPAVPSDYDAVLAASVAMFTEELGVSPLRAGAEAYRERVRRLVQLGRVLIDRVSEPSVVEPVRFKADLGVVSPACVQIQGVWIPPHLRGQGRAAPATASVVDAARRLAPLVSLYVNAYNTAALRSYLRAGFTRVGTFATVLY